MWLVNVFYFHVLLNMDVFESEVATRSVFLSLNITFNLIVDLIQIWNEWLVIFILNHVWTSIGIVVVYSDICAVIRVSFQNCFLLELLRLTLFLDNKSNGSSLNVFLIIRVLRNHRSSWVVHDLDVWVSFSVQSLDEIHWNSRFLRIVRLNWFLATLSLSWFELSIRLVVCELQNWVIGFNRLLLSQEVRYSILILRSNFVPWEATIVIVHHLGFNLRHVGVTRHFSSTFTMTLLDRWHICRIRFTTFGVHKIF